jgi:anthranilate synthase component 2
MRLLMIDNYDSFTYNLVQLFGEFDVDVQVFRHDRISLDQIARLRPHWICISPGPKDPEHAGISKAVIRRFASTVPTLGVCLGMQAINEVFGGITCRAPEPRHGKRSLVRHGGLGIFSGVPSPFEAARYHSLQVIVRSPVLLALAHAEDQVVMGLQHREWPLCGVQFHPESFMTQYGMELIANFLSLHPAWLAPTAGGKQADRFPRVGRLTAIAPRPVGTGAAPGLAGCRAARPEPGHGQWPRTSPRVAGEPGFQCGYSQGG